MIENWYRLSYLSILLFIKIGFSLLLPPKPLPESPAFLGVNKLETADTLFKADLLKRAEQEPKNLEIFMLLEELFKQTDKQQLSIDQNIHTQIKLDHLEDQLNKALKDIEKLKDKVRENGNSHSTNNVSG